MDAEGIEATTMGVEREIDDNNTVQEEEVAANALTTLGAEVAKDDVDDVDDESSEMEIPQRYTKSGRKRAVPFPLKLMKVLSSKKFAHIITWMPSGKSFSIVQPKAFVAEILPEQFKSAKYSSFTRKLHRWGFMRHYRGEEAGAFYHKDFQKDRLDLVEKMTCYKSDASKSSISASVSSTSAPKKAPSNLHGEQQFTAPVLTKKPAHNRVVAQALPHVIAHNPLRQDLVAQLRQKQQLLKVPEITAAERLNAVIEAEVARRIKERIQVAALSRSTYRVLPGQLNPAPQPLGTNNQWNLAASRLQAHLLQIQQQKQQQLSCLLPITAIKSLPEKGLQELPRTNIQGAKTA